MPQAWRIVKTRHAAAAFTGEGARLYGGRWTSKGRPAVYTSATVALATLEILVHIDSTAALASFSLIPVEFPDRLVEDVEPTKLPGDWRSYPAPAQLQALGDAWLAAGRSAVLRVPSAVVPSEFNFILNPAHPDFGGCKVGRPRRHTLDSRLKRKSDTH